MKKDLTLVFGAGKSGISSSCLLAGMGENVLLYDGNEKLDEAALRRQLQEHSSGGDSNIRICLGTLAAEDRERLKEVVVSPGVPLDIPVMLDFQKEGIPITGEVELAYRVAAGSLVAITGTNGKTTTTTLTAEIFKDLMAKGRGTAYALGNIGDPYTDMAKKLTPEDLTVLEVSSFQLETIRTFRPGVSALLNVTPDHLNRHHTMENYTACKLAVTKNQQPGDVFVFNASDPLTAAAVGSVFSRENAPAGACFSSSMNYDELCRGEYAKMPALYLEGEEIFFKTAAGEKARLMNIHDMKLLGTHNVENVMAAILVVMAYYGYPAADSDVMKQILHTVCAFEGVEHRIEYVATVRGVDYYNDSKGTNPDAAIKAVEAMVKPTVLIGGGYDKQNTSDAWIETFGTKVKALVLLGQTREKIAECARAHGFKTITMAENMKEAVEICANLAKEGDAVLLSPACASWGMFDNYEQRGRIFKDCVRAL